MDASTHFLLHNSNAQSHNSAANQAVNLKLTEVVVRNNEHHGFNNMVILMIGLLSKNLLFLLSNLQSAFGRFLVFDALGQNFQTIIDENNGQLSEIAVYQILYRMVCNNDFLQLHKTNKDAKPHKNEKIMPVLIC